MLGMPKDEIEQIQAWEQIATEIVSNITRTARYKIRKGDAVHAYNSKKSSKTTF